MLIRESQAQLSPKPTVMGILNWEAAGVTEAALLVGAHRSDLGPFQRPCEVSWSFLQKWKMLFSTCWFFLHCSCLRKEVNGWLKLSSRMSLYSCKSCARGGLWPIGCVAVKFKMTAGLIWLEKCNCCLCLVLSSLDAGVFLWISYSLYSEIATYYFLSGRYRSTC